MESAILPKGRKYFNTKGYFSMLDHSNKFVETVSSMHRNIRHQDQATQDSILSTLDAKKKRAFRCLIDGKTSAWLAVLPLCTHHFDLSATEFRDALAMRCQCPLLRMPATCDGCVAAFNLEHALDCKIGGGWSPNDTMKSEMHLEIWLQ